MIDELPEIAAASSHMRPQRRVAHVGRVRMERRDICVEKP